ncbi:hypothetical protein SAMN03159444_03267 [Pseudomonas sp. NFACC02]|uniref:hypothetical protein n=1 Tax=Pseudomonas sp. NFACC02 TaxID=1566250 RepID=UPI0008BBA816|nr:hypothetical protein [Pseudomonas sp. NFACC02]SER11672.1 hypothetical protein SAMN03159444_03267 [Pseudomonas sp. NFACC02]
MTSLIAWVAVDSVGPSALYFASDSRITWSGQTRWDFCKKIFSSNSQPEILGFCGDVLFPVQALAQITSLIDSGCLYEESDSAQEKFMKIASVIMDIYSTYPAPHSAPFTIIHGVRLGEGNSTKFEVRKLSWSTDKRFSIEVVPTKEKYDKADPKLLIALGSGKGVIKNIEHLWEKSDIGGTSRAVFSSFCEAVNSGADICTGGAPQLSVLYRKGVGRTLGYVSTDATYFSGVIINNNYNLNHINFYNSSFEICDPVTRVRKDGAKRQPKPKNLKTSDFMQNRLGKEF